MNTIFTIGIFMSLFLAVLLFVKQNKTLSDKVLAAWFVVTATHLFSYYLNYLGYWHIYPHLVGITHPLPFLYGPLLYLYVVFSLRPVQRFNLKDGLHFLPFLVCYLCMIPFLFGFTAEEKMLIDDQNYNSPYKIFFAITIIGFVISIGIYSVLSYFKIANYQRLINENFAYEDNISLQWLRFFIGGLGVVFLIGFLIFIVHHHLEISFGFNADLIVFFCIVLLIFLMGFWGLRQQGIFTEKMVLQSDIVRSKSAEYKKSGLKPTEIQALHERLLLTMTQEKPYLEPKLTLSQLAEKLEISPNNLSQIINQCEGKNFYDFVNSYRISEFINKANSQENKNLNILGIALDSGFNSKSSFNEVFKKQMGKTPSNYLKSQEK